MASQGDGQSIRLFRRKFAGILSAILILILESGIWMLLQHRECLQNFCRTSFLQSFNSSVRTITMDEFDRYHRQAVERAEKEGRMPPLPPLRPLRGRQLHPEEDLFEPRYFAPSRNNITRSSLKPNGTPGLLAATTAFGAFVGYLTYRQMYKPSRVPANYDQSDPTMCQKKYGRKFDDVYPINTVVASGGQMPSDARYGPDAGKSAYYTRNQIRAAEPAYAYDSWHQWELPAVKREQAMEKGEEIIRSVREQ